MCGVFGVISFDDKNVVPDVLDKVFHMQNRGRDSVGLAIANSRNLSAPARFWKEADSASKWFNDQAVVRTIQERLSGNVGIGHVRYATASTRDQRNAQPHYFDHGGDILLVASNGDIPFCAEWREKVKQKNYPFASECDAEVIAKLLGLWIWDEGKSEIEAFTQLVTDLPGAFSLVAITPQRNLVVARDKYGFRPLWLVRTDRWAMVCSESALLEEYGTPQEVVPGTVVVISASGQLQTIEATPPRPHHCLMELFYFSRPDSRFNGHRIDTIRRRFGRQIAHQLLSLADAPRPDLVTSVPYSGGPAAEGAAKELSVNLETVIIKDRFSDRIFQGDEMSRSQMIRRRFTINEELTQDKSVLVIDDSIVRGDQARALVYALRQAGARQITYASTAPAYRHPCFFGINTPDPDKLVAYNRDEAKVRSEIGADVLIYLKLEAIFEVLGSQNFCTGCFTGQYPLPVPTAGRPEV